MVAMLCLNLHAAAPQTEDQALAVLQAATSVIEKEAACLRLKEIGTAKSVPVLKALLTDEVLAQWAVDALETLPVREAGGALLEALPEASGKTKALVVFALGARREAVAVGPLSSLLSDSDVLIAGAAAQALGKIGGGPALAALRAVRPGTTGPVRMAVNDALLMLADAFLAGGQLANAKALYAELRVADASPPVRAAAFRGDVLCAGERKADLVVAALGGADEAERVMAVQLVRELPDANATMVFAVALAKLPSLVQVAMLEALRQRNDPAAAPAMAALARSNKAAVRQAALRALGELGDAAQVGLLAELAVTGAGNERSEARQALIALHRGEVLPAMLAEIQRATPEVKVELVQALARRQDRRALPELVRLADATDARLGVASLQALEKLADDSQTTALLDLIVRAPDSERRDAAVSAFAAVGARSRNAADFGKRALSAMPGATTETRCALLEAAGQIGGPGVFDALRAALQDANAEVRATALRTLAEHGGDAARPDLLSIAQGAPAESERALALSGYWRLVETMTERPPAERLAAVRAGLVATKTVAERKLGLARLGELRGAEALDLAQQHRKDAAVRAEAETACLHIATRLDAAQRTVAESALRELARGAENQRVRAEAQALVAKLEAVSGYLAPWFVSGPYRQAGKEAQQLFDVAFAPERQGIGAAEWRPLPSSSGLTNFWRADLDPIVAGNHCVIYLKARAFCPRAQAVTLEIGSDDGVKVWINRTLVHANNAVRGFTPGEDKAKGALQEGWNEFLVKITQHTAGCAAAVRVRATDGQAIPGLRVEAGE